MAIKGIHNRATKTHQSLDADETLLQTVYRSSAAQIKIGEAFFFSLSLMCSCLFRLMPLPLNGALQCWLSCEAECCVKTVFLLLLCKMFVVALLFTTTDDTFEVFLNGNMFVLDNLR